MGRVEEGEGGGERMEGERDRKGARRARHGEVVC